MNKIRKSDNVRVISGEHRGMQGKVLSVNVRRQMAVVQGVNMIKEHRKADRQRQGGIIEREAPMHLSNLAVVCPACGQASRVGSTEGADGRRVRYCKKCNETIE